MRIRFLASAITAVALCFAATAVSAQTASATVCADGTTSSAVGKDLCVGHGGVKAKATSSVHSHVTCVDATVVDTKDACAGHGGVKSTSSTTRTSTITKKTTPREDTDSVRAIAICKDGLYSHADTRAAACRAHGGVERYLHRKG